MELPPNHINDWLCATQIQTSLPEQELYNRATQPGFIPEVLTARSGSAFPQRNGILCIMFELVQVTYPEAKEESQSIVEVTTVQMDIPTQDTYRIDIRPLNNPGLPDLPVSVFRLNDYRKRNFRK